MMPEFLLNAKIEDTEKMERLEKEKQELKEQLKELKKENKKIMNCLHKNTENLANLVHENDKLRAELNLKIGVLHDNHNLIHAFNDLEDWLEEMLDSENDIFSVIRVKDVLEKIEELRSKDE